MEELQKKIDAVEKKHEELSRALSEKHEQLAGEIGELKNRPAGKARDLWDKLGTPHLTGDESEKKMAIIAISTLTNPETAAKIAQLFPSEGTVSALKSIASQGTKKEQDVAKKALATSLKTMGTGFANQSGNATGNLEAKKYYQEALQMQQDVYGADSTKTVDTLVKLGQLSEKQGRYDQAIGYYDSARKTMIANHRNKTSDFKRILHALSRSYKMTGKMGLAKDFTERATSLGEELTSGKTKDKDSVMESDSKHAESDLDTGKSVDDIQPIQDTSTSSTEDKDKPPAVVNPDVNTTIFDPESQSKSKNSTDSVFSN